MTCHCSICHRNDAGSNHNTDRVEYFLRPNFGPENGLFYHPNQRWVKVQIESSTGELSTLTLSNYEMNLLVEQIRNIQKEHNWSENEK